MKNFWLGWWICVLLTCACTEKVETPDTPEIWTEAQVLEQLATRWSEGDTLPALHSSLRKFFPKPWEPFVRNEVTSEGIYEKSAFFSQAKSVYFQSDDGFVELYIADYAADRGAFLRLIQAFEKIEENPTSFQKIWTEDKKGIFAWERLDQQSQLHYLEAGAYARFHILIRTNLPEGKRNLSQAWQKLPWNILKELKPQG